MANTSISLVDLDFGQIKQNLKNYLSSQETFKDYNFEGSNMSILLDVLSYNTFQNAFYLNMISSEMFLDTAQTDASIISHVKELNYVPRSFGSASAELNITITPAASNVEAVIIDKGQEFIGSIGSNSYTFVTDESVIISNGVNGVFVANNITVYEGQYGTESFVYTSNTDTFTISNKTVDMSSLIVVSLGDDGSNTVTWQKKDNLIDVDANTYAYFVQPAINGSYEIKFGDGVFGVEPQLGSTIILEYRVCAGELANGTRNIKASSVIDGHANVQVNVASSAAGGRINESIESIRHYAPKQYQTQDRAVTASDYEILLKRQFSEIQAISAYGGELATPAQYGKVFIAVDLVNADGIPDRKKQEFLAWIAPRSPVTIEPVFIDPEFTFLDVEATVKYNLNVTTLAPNDIESRVYGTVQQYNADNLQDFNTGIRYSNLLSLIDDTHESIVSSALTIKPYKRFTPQTGESVELNFSFDAPLVDDLPAIATQHAGELQHVISSTPITKSGRKCNIEDDGAGNIRVVTLEGNIHTELEKIGTVNYDTGEVSITNLNIESYDGNFIKIYARLRENDFSVSKNYILEIKNEDIRVDATAIRV